jgi:hypothetical protein
MARLWRDFAQKGGSALGDFSGVGEAVGEKIERNKQDCVPGRGYEKVCSITTNEAIYRALWRRLLA